MNKRSPETDFQLVTPLSVDEIHMRLAAMTVPQRADALIRYKERHLRDHYHGTLHASGFTLQRLTLGATVLPRLKGKYLPGESGTTIVVSSNAGELITSAIAMMIGLTLPMAAIFLAMAFKIWVVAITALIGACFYGYVCLLRMQIITEVDADKKKLAMLLDSKPA